MVYLEVVKQVNLDNCHLKEKKKDFFFFWYLYEMMDVNQTVGKLFYNACKSGHCAA